ncbi:class I SAM-dependent methyltransferase [Dongia deserti]|uniref:class I SAM-dependent methyltransferase n=1 Tax=Dongia deserti TaxID=2268030 RepID=UPI000E64D7B2|nr:class I SAM-dependent methyltransferase [Dongia deserti]
MHGYAESPSRLSVFLAPLMEKQRLIDEIAEPVGVSAPIAFETAQRLCDDGQGGDCRAYHSVWQYLRHSGAWQSIRNDGALFVAAAEQLAREGRLNRGLISGAADYSMLAHVAHGAGRGESRLVIDVVDQCETALRMNEWYAAERGLIVGTFKSTALSFAPEHQYDLVCTHSFLTWQPFADRPLLFRKWADWLRPGGRLCFSDRVSSIDTPYDPAARKERLERLIADALGRLAEQGTRLPCSEAEFADLIRKFGLRFHQDQPAMPKEMVEAWAAEAGLETDLALPIAEVLPGASTPSFLSQARSDRVRMWFEFSRP